MAHCIGPAIDPMQLTSRDPPLDRPSTDAELPELAPAHYAMLAPSQIGDQSIDATRVTFSIDDMGNVGLVRHPAPMVDDRVARVVRQRSFLCDIKEAPARRYRPWL